MDNCSWLAYSWILAAAPRRFHRNSTDGQAFWAPHVRVGMGSGVVWPAGEVGTRCNFSLASQRRVSSGARAGILEGRYVGCTPSACAIPGGKSSPEGDPAGQQLPRAISPAWVPWFNLRTTQASIVSCGSPALCRAIGMLAPTPLFSPTPVSRRFLFFGCAGWLIRLARGRFPPPGWDAGAGLQRLPAGALGRAGSSLDQRPRSFGLAPRQLAAAGEAR